MLNICIYQKKIVTLRAEMWKYYEKDVSIYRRNAVLSANGGPDADLLYM